MMIKILGILLIFVFSSGNAALTNRGGGFIYDDVLDITWMQNANINGMCDWFCQIDWAALLSIVDTRPGAGGAVYDDWRLASMDVNLDQTAVDCASATELACRDNEYGYLFYQYGVSQASPGIFTDVQSFYWNNEEFIFEPGSWVFEFSGGTQIEWDKLQFFSGWAVRQGDVGVVPVPAAAWLFGSALGLLGWIRRRVS